MSGAVHSYSWQTLAEFSLNIANNRQAIANTASNIAETVAANLSAEIGAVSGGTGSTISRVPGEYRQEFLEGLITTIKDHISFSLRRANAAEPLLPVIIRILVERKELFSKGSWGVFFVEKGSEVLAAHHTVEVYLYSEGKPDKTIP